MADFDEFNENLRGAVTAFKEKRWSDVMTSAELAISLYPEYVGPSSPYLLLAKAAKHSAMNDESTDALMRYWQAGGRNPEALKKLAHHYYDTTRQTQAIAVQRVLTRAEPLSLQHRDTLSGWLYTARSYEQALAEYQAVLSLQPHDKASAHFNLARTLHHLNRTEEARRQLLYALEIAPRFSPALSLLVEINQ